MKIKRILRTTFRHIKRNGWFSFGSISVISMTFFITSLILIFNYVVNVALDDIEKKGQIVVFFNVGTDEDYIMDLKARLEATGKTSSVVYRSEEEAMRIFLEMNKDDPTIADILDEGILPASLHINTNKLDDLDDILTLLNNEASSSDNIDEINDNKNITDILSEINYWTRYMGIIAFIIMAFISLTIIVITIASNIKAHEQEIEIMSLVGGNTWYIRLPYILEGASYGAMGSIFSIILLITLGYVSSIFWESSATAEFITNYFGRLNWPEVNSVLFVEIALIKILVGIIIGSVSSFLAVFKYLK